jgi:hypothetical protein
MSFTKLEARWLLLVAVGCSQPAAADGKYDAATSSHEAVRSPLPSAPVVTDPAASRQPLPPFVMPYPRGRWRLAEPAALDGVVLWIDQILIRHDEARREVSFNLAYWFSVPPPPGRTREQALALAQRVADEAATHEGAFSDLARRYSEDLPSRDEGGELGGLSASELSGWPQVLDALAVIPPGRASKVVETRYGFHIFCRRPPPPEQTLSGSHIVIGHEQAEWLKVQARGPLPKRSRSEALSFATDLYRQAVAQPERFQKLVDRYSEHRDAVLGGQFGSWSSREPNPFPARMRRLRQLAPGEVGAPVETHLGFEVILRTDALVSERYAVRAARLPFDPGAPDTADSSRTRVLAHAEALARSYAKEPWRFGAPGEWPTARLQWQSGRGVPGVELQIRDLEVGAVASSPVQTEFSFQISQRVAPDPVSVPHYPLELPAPAQPDVRFHLAQLPAERQRELLSESSRIAQPNLRLSKPELVRLQELLASAALADPNDPASAAAAVELVLKDTRTLLGPRGYDLYLAALQREMTSALLGAAADSASERGI